MAKNRMSVNFMFAVGGLFGEVCFERVLFVECSRKMLVLMRVMRKRIRFERGDGVVYILDFESYFS